MINSADGADEAIKRCVTKLTRYSLQGQCDLATSLENLFRGNLDDLLVIPDNGDRAKRR